MKEYSQLATADSPAAEWVPLACCSELGFSGAAGLVEDDEVMELFPTTCPSTHTDSAGTKKLHCTIFHKAGNLTVDLRHTNSFSCYSLMMEV